MLLIRAAKAGHRDYPLLLLVFYSIRYFASCDTKNMSSSIPEERRRRFEICRECGAPNEPGMRQLDGSIKYVCTRNSRHIAYDNTDAKWLSFRDRCLWNKNMSSYLWSSWSQKKVERWELLSNIKWIHFSLLGDIKYYYPLKCILHTNSYAALIKRFD